MDTSTQPTQRRQQRPSALVMYSLDPDSSKLKHSQPPPESERYPAFGKPLYLPSTSPNVPEHVQIVASALSAGGFDTSVINVEDDVDHIMAGVVVKDPTIIFNLVSEFEGDLQHHSLVASLFELLGETYTSGDTLCLARCADRVTTHLILANAGVPVPPFVVIRDINAVPDTSDLKPPYIVTQAFDDIYPEEGLDYPIESREELIERVEELYHEFELPFLVEEYVGHRRIHAIVLGNRMLQVLPLTETDLHVEPEAEAAGEQPSVASEASQANNARGETYDPAVLAQLAQDHADRIRALAERAFRAMGCRDVAQIDFHIDPAGTPYVVDVRPLPSYRSDHPLGVAADLDERGSSGVIFEIAKAACTRAGLRVPTPRPQPAPARGSQVGSEQPGQGVAQLDEERPAGEVGEGDLGGA